MPQIQLPFFPAGATLITNELAFKCEDNKVVYFNGTMPIFSHNKDDIKSFKMITSQFCVNGNTRLVDIARSFGVPEISVKRAVKLYREKGPEGFYRKRAGRKSTILTKTVLAKAQEYLNKGNSRLQISKLLSIKDDTLRKAIKNGRLQQNEKKKIL